MLISLAYHCRPTRTLVSHGVEYYPPFFIICFHTTFRVINTQDESTTLYTIFIVVHVKIAFEYVIYMTLSKTEKVYEILHIWYEV